MAAGLRLWVSKSVCYLLLVELAMKNLVKMLKSKIKKCYLNSFICLCSSCVGYKRDQAKCLLNFIAPLSKLAVTASIISIALGWDLRWNILNFLSYKLYLWNLIDLRLLDIEYYTLKFILYILFNLDHVLLYGIYYNKLLIKSRLVNLNIFLLKAFIL